MPQKIQESKGAHTERCSENIEFEKHKLSLLLGKRNLPAEHSKYFQVSGTVSDNGRSLVL